MTETSEQFLEAYFNEETAVAGSLFRLLLVERIEEKIIDKLASRFPDAQVVEQENKDNEETENEGGDNERKKKRKELKTLSTQQKVTLGSKTEIDLEPETDEVQPKDLGPVTGTKISEGLTTAIAGALVKHVVTKAASRAGINLSLVHKVLSAYHAAKSAKKVNTDAKKQPKPGALTITKAGTPPPPPKSVT